LVQAVLLQQTVRVRSYQVCLLLVAHRVGVMAAKVNLVAAAEAAAVVAELKQAVLALLTKDLLAVRLVVQTIILAAVAALVL
jgi:hypothetical protein